MSCSKDGTLRLWDVATAASEILISHPRGPELEYLTSVLDCSFSPDGELIAAASGGYGYGALGLWNGVTGAEVIKLAEEKVPLVACGFSLDGTRIYSVSNGYDTIAKCSFSPDGKRIVAAMKASVETFTLRLLDASTGT